MCIVICTLLLSRPARGAWVEIRGIVLKSRLEWSRPARGAWVEISFARWFCSPWPSRPARGAWVEINKGFIYSNMGIGRAPQGARGLKSFEGSLTAYDDRVAPRKGRVG